MNKEEEYINNLKYSDVTRAISREFFRLICVNTDTDYYVEFIPHEQDERFDIRDVGKDFKDVVQYFSESAYPADSEMVRLSFTKQNVLKALETEDSFALNYRMMIGETPTYVRLQATRIRKEDPGHLLIGLSNNDAYIQQMEIYERTLEENLTFASISEALTSDYVCIFYVNTQNGEFIEYSSSERYKSYGFPHAGADFFEMCKSHFSRIVFEEDRDIFLRAFDKENLMKALAVDRLFHLTFRVVINDVPNYVRVKISNMNGRDSQHIVIGLSNIESTMQRVQQYEQMKEIANRDSLTGVKSKHAYMEDVERLDRDIQEGVAVPFAIVVFDVNGLKMINDTQGHKAGDNYLRRSCKMISNVFSHSPIYRVGGDEFVALLSGDDYENRMQLLKELHDLSVVHIGTKEAIVSAGISEYNPPQDHNVGDVFERADALMYKEKMLLKSLGAATREEEARESGEEGEEIPIINLRKHILIADDQETNREILGSLLSTDYEILYASDGVETMDMLRAHKEELALLILDLYMPRMNGREVLREMQVDEELMGIPVIMLTIDQDAELDSLKLGAMDFISKPYPDINIVKARIAKCIELSENRDLIRHTQRDRLTGLLHFDYFLRYLYRFDHLYTEEVFDAFLCDIQHFHDVNEKYGRQFGDLVLRSIGMNFRKLARKTGGIGCRQGGDTFLLYCPHQDNYEELIVKFQEDLFVEKDTADKVRLKFGVFTNASAEPDIEERFIRAKIAADSVLDDPEKICGFYQWDSDIT